MQKFMSIMLPALLLVSAAVNAEELNSQPRKFFAFDNGLRQADGLNEKAALLVELGYDGIAWRPAKTTEMLQTLDRHGLKMLSTYVTLTANEAECNVPPGVVREIEALKGHDTVVWLAITGKSNDEVVVPVIQQVCDIAAKNSLQVAIYPHVGFYTDTTATALELANKADRHNLGVSFNLCHFLKQNDESDLKRTLHAAADKLLLVSINGADSGATRKMGWDRLIRPLGEGSFDVGQVLDLLDEIGYAGPVGLQCYALPGDDRENLSRSMETWKTLTARR